MMFAQLHFVWFLNIENTIECLYSLVEYKHMPIPHSQYHGCWCPGDTSCQGISSHDIDKFVQNKQDLRG